MTPTGRVPAPGDGAAPLRGLVTGLVLLASTGLFALGARFDLDPFDSAELALVAVTGGLGHPPGQPLHTLVGWVLTRGPWRPLAALTWLSVLPAAAMFATAAYHGVGRASVSARPLSPSPSHHTALRVAAAAGAVLVACGLYAVREVACRVEVYALAAALATGGVFVAAGRTPRADVTAGVLLGLAAAVNPVVAAQGVGAAVVATRGRAGSRALAALARMAAGALGGLGAYAYAWVVAPRVGVTLVWGAPHDARSFVRLLTAADFQRNVSLSGATLAANLAHLGQDLARAGVLPYVALGAWGLFVPSADEPAPAPGRRDGAVAALALALLVGALMLAANVPYLPANPDYGGYLLVPLALASAGAARLAWHARGARVCTAGVLAGGAVLALALPGVLAAGRPSGATRALATEALSSAPRGAVVVLASDHLLFPALYLQRVEGLRPDVTVLNPGWASSSWAWRYAMARDPTLVVDLTPGRGGGARLAGALRARWAGRPVVSESLALLRAGASGEVCPRGILWSSQEGCGHARRWIARGVGVLQREAERAARASWDARIVMSTARSVGDQALELGCPGLAARYYAAGLPRGYVPAARGPLCDGRRVTPPPPVGLMAVTAEDLVRAVRTAGE